MHRLIWNPFPQYYCNISLARKQIKLCFCLIKLLCLICFLWHYRLSKVTFTSGRMVGGELAMGWNLQLPKQIANENTSLAILMMHRSNKIELPSAFVEAEFQGSEETLFRATWIIFKDTAQDYHYWKRYGFFWGWKYKKGRKCWWNTVEETDHEWGQ